MCTPKCATFISVKNNLAFFINEKFVEINKIITFGSNNESAEWKQRIFILIFIFIELISISSQDIAFSVCSNNLFKKKNEKKTAISTYKIVRAA